MHHKDPHVDMRFKRLLGASLCRSVRQCVQMITKPPRMLHHSTLSIIKVGPALWVCLTTTPNRRCRPLPWNNLPLLALPPPPVLINRPLCRPASWISRFATGVAQHTKSSIVYLVTNPVSLVVADVFLSVIVPLGCCVLSVWCFYFCDHSFKT